MKSRLFISLLAAALALGSAGFVHADEPTTIKFSDPAKPGTVKILLANGSLKVRGADVSEVSVKSDSKAVTAKPRKDGMRVLSSASSYALGEKDNLITLDAVSEGWGGGGGDFTLTVPRNTRVTVISRMGGADISCNDLDGDLDITAMNGDIRLDGIGGGVTVESMNGQIRAGVRQLQDNKPLSFTSMHGEVVIRLPEQAKANLRLRTQNGSVLTDFDESVLTTKTENTPRQPSAPRRTTSSRTPKTPPVPPADGVAPAAPVAPAAAPAPAPVAPRAGLSEDDRDQIRRSTEEAVRASKEMARDAAAMGRDAAAMARDVAISVKDGITIGMKGGNWSIPTISGGKLVTGTLNGGGPEISVSTMSGDVKVVRATANPPVEKK